MVDSGRVLSVSLPLTGLHGEAEGESQALRSHLVALLTARGGA